MRNLILTAAFVAICGGALAGSPEEAERASNALQAALPSDIGSAADPASLREAAPLIENTVKENLFTGLGYKDPCGQGATWPAAAGCNVAVGVMAMSNATTLDHSTFIGRCSGVSARTGTRDLLVGDYTAMPDGASGFVNIANKLCFWRDSGERVACPAPEPECGGK